eukprot:scaffold34928_cov54-Attheya_sp.AAC.7
MPPVVGSLNQHYPCPPILLTQRVNRSQKWTSYNDRAIAYCTVGYGIPVPGRLPVRTGTHNRLTMITSSASLHPNLRHHVFQVVVVAGAGRKSEGRNLPYIIHL